MTTTEAQKRATKAWRERNRDAYNAYNRVHSLTYYNANSNKCCAYKKEFYYYKNENSYEWVAKQFLKILR